MRYKFLRWLAPALMVVGLGCIQTAHAAWSLEPLKWKRWTPCTAQPYKFAGATNTTDTTWIDPIAANVDTSSAWSTLDADNAGMDAATTVDSSVVGAFVISVDSSVASAVNYKSTTVAIQVNYGSSVGGWNTVATFSVLPTDGVKNLYCPVFGKMGPATADLGVDYAATGAMAVPAMRAIVTWGSSVAAAGARCWFKKYIRGNSVDRQYSPYAPLNP